MIVSPYPYQKKVFEAISNGRNVILQAPTGTGKTLASLLPIFHRFDAFDAIEENGLHALPLKCCYAVPMRVLANQFKKECDGHIEKLKIGGTTFFDAYQRLNIPVPSIQTGETPEDAQFESPLTFCTIDQLLASFLGAPYSLGHNRANINVGAIVDSYLILDEFHLYPFEKNGNGARLTTLAMLKLLKGYSPFCMMTATFSTKLLSELGTLLDAEVIRVEDEDELATIMRGRSRTIQTTDHSLIADDVLSSHIKAMEQGKGASLAICNTVARSQELYLDVMSKLAEYHLDSVEVHLLHSRFTPEDRKEKSDLLQQLMGEEQWKDGHFIGQSVIVIATQVVEVGLNISSSVLHSEIAPANSLIQRAGRCARFAGQQGQVFIYRLSANEKGNISYKPYDEPLCLATFDELERLVSENNHQPVPFGFKEEQALIDHVHTEEDKRMLSIFEENQNALEDAIFKNLATHDSGNTSSLIRDVTQVQIIIHNDPNEAIQIKPFIWQSFGMHPGSLMGAWDDLQKRGSECSLDWVMRQAIAISSEESSEDDSTRVASYTWDVVTKPQQINGALRIALPTALAAYDDKIGFRLLLDGPIPSDAWQSKQLPEKWRSKHEEETGKIGSYVEHISGLMRAYHSSNVKTEMKWIAHRLETELELPAGTLDFAICLAIGCHDIGKLSKKWQEWARYWQNTLAVFDNPGRGDCLNQPEYRWLAKTDRLTWKEERDLQKQYPQKPRPHHACEGAIASWPVILQAMSNRKIPTKNQQAWYLATSIMSAIARHHTPLADTYQEVAWDPAAREVIAEAFAACKLEDVDIAKIDLLAKKNGTLDPERQLFRPNINESIPATWLAFTIVRALRLCDQRAERV